MPVFVRDDVRVLYVHIPKTGGTTLEHEFKAAGWHLLMRETRRRSPTLLPVRTCSPQHYHADLLRSLFHVDRFDFVFTVTREPMVRFKSEYLMRNPSNPVTDPAAVDRWAEDVLAQLAADPWLFDNHLRPQVEFLLTELPAAKVYRLEEGLDEIAADLNRQLDARLPAELPRRLDSTASRGVSSSDVQISPKLEATLREVYAEDFARLGY